MYSASDRVLSHSFTLRSEVQQSHRLTHGNAIMNSTAPLPQHEDTVRNIKLANTLLASLLSSTTSLDGCLILAVTILRIVYEHSWFIFMQDGAERMIRHHVHIRTSHGVCRVLGSVLAFTGAKPDFNDARPRSESAKFPLGVILHPY